MGRNFRCPGANSAIFFFFFWEPIKRSTRDLPKFESRLNCAPLPTKKKEKKKQLLPVVYFIFNPSRANKPATAIVRRTERRPTLPGRAPITLSFRRVVPFRPRRQSLFTPEPTDEGRSKRRVRPHFSVELFRSRLESQIAIGTQSSIVRPPTTTSGRFDSCRRFRHKRSRAIIAVGPRPRPGDGSSGLRTQQPPPSPRLVILSQSKIY